MRFLPHVQEWIEEYISAPAWNHIVFTNNPQFLYADYLISPTIRPRALAPVSSLVPTSLRLGKR